MCIFKSPLQYTLISSLLIVHSLIAFRERMMKIELMTKTPPYQFNIYQQSSSFRRCHWMQIISPLVYKKKEKSGEIKLLCFCLSRCDVKGVLYKEKNLMKKFHSNCCILWRGIYSGNLVEMQLKILQSYWTQFYIKIIIERLKIFGLRGIFKFFLFSVRIFWLLKLITGQNYAKIVID